MPALPSLPGAFELFVARRYLRAKRKEAAISLITGISVLGVAAGVMALIIALAINNGFQNTIQNNLLGATAHVSVLMKDPQVGIERWPALVHKFRQQPHVKQAVACLYGQVFLTSSAQSSGAVLKGIAIDPVSIKAEIPRLREGSVEGLQDNQPVPGIILGIKLAQSTGYTVGQVVSLISPRTNISPMGIRPRIFQFKVAGIFESGFPELDSTFTYTSLEAAQRVLALPDVVNTIELKLDDLNLAGQVAADVPKIAGPDFTASTWMDQNRPLRNAFQMEKVVTAITIGLIQLVAGLNIFITLVLMVMEKYRDIAVLMSMGARREQVRNIFMLQGLLIGAVGTAAGVIVGQTICFLADRYRWIRLDADVYALSYVPFEPHLTDTLLVAGTALLVSLLATIYPARNATRILPVEALRYE